MSTAEEIKDLLRSQSPEYLPLPSHPTASLDLFEFDDAPSITEEERLYGFLMELLLKP